MKSFLVSILFFFILSLNSWAGNGFPCLKKESYEQTALRMAQNPQSPINQDEERRMALIDLKNAKKGDAFAQVNLGLRYLLGQNQGAIPHDEVLARQWFKVAASRKYPDAQHYLALMLVQGRGGGQSLREAFFWEKKAAINGHLGAMNSLGTMYEYGIGTEASFEKAFSWYYRAAHAFGAGHAMAQNNLGLMYERGLWVPKNLHEAFRNYEKSALQGNRVGQYNLGLAYEEGLGVNKNLREAIYWFGKAAKKNQAALSQGLAINLDPFAYHGYPPAQRKLGEAFEKGWAGFKDYQRAAHWYLQAAMHGDTLSHLYLGKIYYEGRAGIPPNQTLAEHHFRAAASFGNDRAQFYLDQVIDMKRGVFQITAQKGFYGDHPVSCPAIKEEEISEEGRQTPTPKGVYQIEMTARMYQSSPMTLPPEAWVEMDEIPERYRWNSESKEEKEEKNLQDDMPVGPDFHG